MLTVVLQGILLSYNLFGFFHFCPHAALGTTGAHGPVLNRFENKG